MLALAGIQTRTMLAALAQRQTYNLLIPGERPELSDQLYRFAAVSGSVEIPGYVGRRGQLYNCVGKSCDYETQKLNRRGSTTFNASLTLPDLYLGHCVWYVGMITWYLGHCIWYLWMIIWHFIKIRLGAVIWERRWQQPLPDPPVEGGYTLWSSIYPLLLLVSVSLVSVSWRDGVMNKSTASIK